MNAQILGVNHKTQTIAAKAFFVAMWGADETGILTRVHMIAEKAGDHFNHYHVRTVDEAVREAKRISAAGSDAYFACATFENFTDGAAGNRTKDNALGAHAFWFDLDCGPDKGYPDKSSAYSALKSFCKEVGLPRPSFIVDSGNGYHVYWCFPDFIEKSIWIEHARGLKALTKSRGLILDQKRTADIASVLRIPSTGNFKEENQ